MTLVELLVVIALLGIFAAIVVYNLTGVNRAGSQAACETDLESVQAAADAYRGDNHGTLAPSVDALTPAYLHTKPTDLGAVTINADGSVASTTCSLH